MKHLRIWALLALTFSAGSFSSCEEEPFSNCVCPEIYAPVCGDNNVTYSNECFAHCDGIQNFTQGECP